MTDKEYNELKRKLSKIVRVWSHKMGLGWYRIDIKYVNDFAYDKNTDTRDVAATTKSDWQYRQALITFYMPKLAPSTDEELIETVVHELAHVLISPIEDFTDDSVSQMTEYTTTCVANALLWVHKGVKK
jgi:hypothetical protein